MTAVLPPPELRTVDDEEPLDLTDAEQLAEHVDALGETCRRCYVELRSDFNRTSGIVTLKCPNGHDVTSTVRAIRRTLPAGAAALIAIPVLPAHGATLETVPRAAAAIADAAGDRPDVFRHGDRLVTVRDGEVS